VPHAQEHVLAARLLTQAIDAGHARLRTEADALAATTLNGLHARLRAMDDALLTARVRGAADQADELSTALSAEARLGVKGVNDRIDLLLRRRRRRFRWLRRGGYVALEWTLLGLMWWVWLMVVVVRLARGVVRGVYLAVRWVLWL
jgi:hypothetical protein